MFDEAIAAFTNAVDVDPANGVIHVKLSQLWLNHGNEPGKAIRHLQEARKLCTDRETSRKIEELMESLKVKGAAQLPPAPD
jgi:predicted Zn-dependent protease